LCCVVCGKKKKGGKKNKRERERVCRCVYCTVERNLELL